MFDNVADRLVLRSVGVLFKVRSWALLRSYGRKFDVGVPFCMTNADLLFTLFVKKSEGNDPRCRLVMPCDDA